jgi:uracil-DNA glycosylase
MVLLEGCLRFCGSREALLLAERDPVPWLVRLIESGTPVLVTFHPSYLLRIRDHDDRERERRRFISDLKSIGDHLNALLMTARQNA